MSDAGDQISTVPSFPPTGVRVAGAIWLAQGGLILLGVFGWLGWSVWLMATKQGLGSACCDGWILLAPGLLGYLLVRMGLSFVLGTAGSTMPLGIASTAMGVPVFVASTVVGTYQLFTLLATWDIQSSGPTAAQWLGLAVGFVIGASWLASGLLLLRSRRAYQEYKRGRRAGG